jgi:hypothetical protein
MDDTVIRHISISRLRLARFRRALPRTRFVVPFLLIIGVINVGHAESTYLSSGPSGFTRIARDLSRKFCTGEPVDSSRQWTLT